MVQLWLVDRSVDSRDLVTLVYATTDGEYVRRKQFALETLRRRGRPVTAAIDADRDELDPADDGDRERFAAEATRMADEHDPDNPV